MLISPVIVSVCKRKSTRLTAVLGGLVLSLGLLFTSFATQLHQVYLSYGVIVAFGGAMVRDPTSLMVGQYFKKKRDVVEIVHAASSGLGLAAASAYLQWSIISLGWRLGLQSITAAICSTIFLAIFYRSASLYHPQRRAILHLKSQRRKIKSKDKEKNKANAAVVVAGQSHHHQHHPYIDRPPYVDLAALRSRTVRLLLISIFVAAGGIFTPVFFLVNEYFKEEMENDGAQVMDVANRAIRLQVQLGLAWALGCLAFGFAVIGPSSSRECRVSKQYLCQIALILIFVSTVTLASAVRGFNGFSVFVWVYGFGLGGFHYSLRSFLYEKVRARNFARAWGFAQGAMALPLLFGIPMTGN